MKKFFKVLFKILGKVIIVGLIAFVVTFGIYMTNAENKLIYYVVRPFLNKHYDSQVRDRRIWPVSKNKVLSQNDFSKSYEAAPLFAAKSENVLKHLEAFKRFTMFSRGVLSVFWRMYFSLTEQSARPAHTLLAFWLFLHINIAPKPDSVQEPGFVFYSWLPLSETVTFSWFKFTIFHRIIYSKYHIVLRRTIWYYRITRVNSI